MAISRLANEIHDEIMSSYCYPDFAVNALRIAVSAAIAVDDSEAIAIKPHRQPIPVKPWIAHLYYSNAVQQQPTFH